MNTPADMPPLPEPQRECWIGHQLYTPEQMHAYAREYAASIEHENLEGWKQAAHWRALYEAQGLRSGEAVGL